jgi:N-acetylmuramoyl-L-alanine amidase
VLLTRTGDEFVPLGERIAIARRAGGDLFVSIHANSAPNTRAKGAEVFFLSPRGASDQLAEELADRENAALLVPEGNAHREDDDLLSILVDLQGSGIQQLSSAFAERVLSELGQAAASARAVRQANFVVLRSLSMPSVLIEVGFLSNPAEARRLATPAGRVAIAEAIADAVLAQLAQHGSPTPVQSPAQSSGASSGRELGPR